MLGLAPSKTHLFLWFQIVHASKMIREFNPPLAIPEVAMLAFSHHSSRVEVLESAAPLAAGPYTKTAV
jgi:hypothetical protein